MPSLKMMITNHRNYIHARDLATDHGVRLTGQFAEAMHQAFTDGEQAVAALTQRVEELEQAQVESKRPSATTTAAEAINGARIRDMCWDEISKGIPGMATAAVTAENPSLWELSARRAGKTQQVANIMKIATYDNLCASYGVESGHLTPFVEKLKEKAGNTEKLEVRLHALRDDLNAARDSASDANKLLTEVYEEFDIVPGNLKQAFRNLKVMYERLRGGYGVLKEGYTAVEDSRLEELKKELSCARDLAALRTRERDHARESSRVGYKKLDIATHALGHIGASAYPCRVSREALEAVGRVQ